MVKIAAELPMNAFADKIAERTGLSPESVVHVLTTAMILANEASSHEVASEPTSGVSAAGQKVEYGISHDNWDG